MSKSEFVNAAVKGIGELVTGAAKSAVDNLIPTLKETGKEVLKDTLKEGAQATLNASVEHLSEKDSKLAKIASQTLQAVGEKHLGQNYERTPSEDIAQTRYKQLSDNEQKIAELNKLEGEIKQTATMKMR
jgi:hypothetical protein